MVRGALVIVAPINKEQVKLSTDPGPGTFAAACAIYGYSLLYLAQNSARHRYQFRLLFLGGCIGLALGLALHPADHTLTRALASYTPWIVLLAQFLSMLTGIVIDRARCSCEGSGFHHTDKV